MEQAPHPYNATPSQAPDTASAPAQDAARTDRNLRVLDEMIEAGVELVRRTRAGMVVTDNQEAGFTQAERCARLVRAVERTVALSAWIIKDRRLAAAHHQKIQAEAASLCHTDRKQQLNHFIGKAIDAAPREKAAVLARRYHIRMHDWDIEHDLAHHSVEDVIIRLCAELGIAPPSPEASPAAAPASTVAPPASPKPAPSNATVPFRPLSAADAARLERALALHDPP